MPFDNERSKKELLQWLSKPRQVLLIVGSGSSRWVGYPSWEGLLEDLRREFLPDVGFPNDLDLLHKASFIRNSLRGLSNPQDRLKQYREYLEKIFRSRKPPFVDWHLTLVRLPFCGIATTNYDPVLEAAVSYLRAERKQSPCRPVDACGKPSRHIFQFFRSLNDDLEIDSVLHLHGYCDNAEGLILTAEDYAKWYEGLTEDAAEIAAAHPAGPLATQTGSLDTLHRKIVWALLAARPVLFVGFSVEDPAFQVLLNLVKEDFDFGYPAHIAILPCSPADADERERERLHVADRLAPLGVRPLFYDVTLDAAGKQVHDGLPLLIEELASSITGTPGSSDIGDLTRKMLGR